MDQHQNPTPAQPTQVTDAEIVPQKPQEKIELSQYTRALIESVNTIHKKSSPGDEKLTVSRTVSFFAFVYEKVRNAIEYREEHLVLRAAIERVLKRRLSMNPKGEGEAENLLRELVWARYFGSGNLGDKDIDDVQHIIDCYLNLRKLIVTGRDGNTKHFINEFLIDLMTCEIEEYLNPEHAERESNYTYFIYQILRQKIVIEQITEEQKDSFFLVALDKAYRKSDMPYLRYHLFTTFYRPIHTYPEAELHQLSSKLTEVFKRIDTIIKNPVVDRLTRYVRKQLPSFLIFFDILDKKGIDIKSVLATKDSLWHEVDFTCRDKYSQTQSRLRNLAVKSLVYIFITKMVLALILEVPVSQYFFHEINWTAIAINSLFPPLLMLIIVLFVKLPNEENTKNIFKRIIDIVDQDESFEKAVNYKSKKPKGKRPILAFGFTVFYSLTFFITLLLIHEGLQLLHFNPASEIIFVFFVSVVSFFSYRIKQVANEYKLEERESIFAPFVDFFFMPILSLGKFFSAEIGKLNFFILIFDFIIEAPFKLVFEIVEEWIKFVRQRKEEIV